MKKKYFDNAVYLILLYIIIIFFSLLSFFLIFGEVSQKSGILPQALWLIGEIFLMYGGFCLFRARKAMGGKKELEEEIVKLEQVNEECMALYESIEERRKNISFLRHDLANHIQTIMSVAGEKNNEIVQRIEKIKTQLNSSAEIKYCLNPVVNMFIQQRINELKMDGYRVDKDIMLGNIDNIEYEELCIIYQLLVDNITALPGECDYIYIRLRIKKESKSGAIISYRIERKIKEKVNIKELCKKAKHTYEMELVRYFAEKLDGTVLMSCRDNKIIEAGMLEVKKYE